MRKQQSKHTAATVRCMALMMMAAALSSHAQESEKAFVNENLAFATRQLNWKCLHTDSTAARLPHSMTSDGTVVNFGPKDWTSGFFPGLLWMVAEWNDSEAWAERAGRWTEKLAPVQYYKGTHDIGFMINCSYGRAYDRTPNDSLQGVLVNAAQSLCSRFNPTTGTIKSWDSYRSMSDGKQFEYPVIIDNMMNLELLFVASRLTGDESYRNVAITHANNTMKNHVRKDGSTFHVVSYDPNDGKVLRSDTHQGYADNSTWSRGQAWGIYGFTVCYRETHDKHYLKTAFRCADFFLHHPNLPSDRIPWFDFNAYSEGFTPGKESKCSHGVLNYRDASAAAITASALLELSTYAKGKRADEYRREAVAILHTLGSDNYRAQYGENGGFILRHCTGSAPHGKELDAPLIYADYYFVEALLRYNKLLQQEK